MAGSSAILRLEDLTKVFGRVKAVDGVSLEVDEGEIFTLLGPSGCGKTTTLRLIAGLENPDGGKILFGDRPIVSVPDRINVPSHKRNLGMVFQSYAIWPHMTVFDNVAYPLKVRRVRGRDIRQRVLAMLELVGLEGLAQRQAPQLSGGQQQRVALARALVAEPSLLLLDEPFSNLDAKLREEMRLQLKVLLRRVGTTTIFVTHDQDEALSLSDHIAVMSNGRVEQLDAPQRLYEQPNSSFVRDFLGRMVLLAATVDATEAEDRLAVQLSGGVNVSLSASANGHQLSTGQAITVAVRPEDIKIVAPGEPSINCLTGEIEALLFLGDHYECRVRLASGEEALIHTPRLAAPKEGESLTLRLPESVTVWPR
jgi:ABC-type Fe3+/spermidine/putrescine transport system ATPase subunit